MKSHAPPDAEDARGRGNACYREGGYEKAALCACLCLHQLRSVSLTAADAGYTKALELCAAGADDELAAALYANRAECSRQLGKPREVVEDCSAALQLNARHPKALLRRAMALEQQERFAKAAEDYEALAALGGAAEQSAREGARRCRKAESMCGN